MAIQTTINAMVLPADLPEEKTESPSASESSDSESESNSASDSDSLDSQASRKRRKISPTRNVESFTPRLSVPSRIKSAKASEKEALRDLMTQQTKNGCRKISPTPNVESFISRLSVPPRIKSVKAPEKEILRDLITQQTINTAIRVPLDAQTTFADLNVKPWLVESLSAMAIKRPTPIQKLCIPEILEGRDCIGGSRTGSGKTVAFAAPILQKWAEDPFGIYALILTPTRELALQIFEQFKAISAPQSLKPILITGGSDMRAEATALARRPHVVIATPGRLADHIENSGEDTVCGFRRVKMVVLDEADRLLTSGNIGSMLPDVEKCLSILPAASKRQTLLFTATITPEVRALKELPQTPGKPPIFVCEVDTRKLAIPTSLKQMYLQIPVTHREHYLHMLLLTDKTLPKSVIIFCNRTATADYLTHLLRLLDHRVTALHSKLPQRQRTDNLGRFRAAAARILVATDVAARGLDIPEVGLVINYDIPRDPDDYIHRVGRTARASRKGDAVTIVGVRDVQLVKAIEARVGRPMVAWEEEGVNLETRVLREALKLVGEKKREAMLEIEEGREVGGKRKRGMKKLNAR